MSGRPFPASPAAGEAEAGPRRDDDKLAGWGGVTATYGPSSQSRQSRQELGGIYEAILSSPSKGKRQNILRATATHGGSARGTLLSAAIPTRGSSKHQWQTSPREPAEGPQQAIKRGRGYLRSPQSHPPPPAPAAPTAGLPAAFKEEAMQFRAQTSPQVSPMPLGLSLRNPLP